jgi:glutaredoxin
MKNSIKKFVLFIFLLLIIPINVMAVSSNYQDKIANITQSKTEKNKINLYFFRGEGCPHCAQEEKWLEVIKKKYSKYLNVYDFEVWYNKTNANYLNKVQNVFHYKVTGVPFTVIGNNYYVGYSETSASKMENQIKEYLEGESSKVVKVPILGKIDMKKASIPLVAVVLGFIDGFNPCAMWVLLFLINMLFKIKSKQKRWILGIAFLLSSAVIYFLSMLGINFVLTVTTISYLKILIAIFILVAGVINLKKYIQMRQEAAGCSVVDDKKRKNLVIKIKKIIDSNSFLIALVGIIVLGASINLIELACSLGFPVIFTELLNLNNITGIAKILYLLLYICFYMLDDLVVFVISMVTLEATGITNKYNKLCTLISSIIMIIMGLLLLFKPEWLMLSF